ncbi:MAG: hypothetical protein M3P51_02785 [Chloroflexota bacterium]|nr:hypothetical protein [Chloroflexota bacterium]
MKPRVLGLVVALLSGGCDEQPYRRYADAADAIAAGERERGWLPVWLPKSARDVHLQNDVDTNEWWLRAQVSPAAADSLRPLLLPVDPDSVELLPPNRGSRWWFEGLIQHHPENDWALNAELFRGRGSPVPRTTVVAFDRSSETIFVWSVAER